MTAVRPHPRPGREAGMVGLEVPLGVLVFVIGALLVANAWGVVDAKGAATAAAREAARAYVEAGSERAALDAAEAAAGAALAGHGRDPAKATFAVIDGRFARCARVVYEVTYPVPAISLPWIGGYGDGFDVRARHSEVVDPYRSGPGGTATCG